MDILNNAQHYWVWVYYEAVQIIDFLLNGYLLVNSSNECFSKC